METVTEFLVQISDATGWQMDLGLEELMFRVFPYVRPPDRSGQGLAFRTFSGYNGFPGGTGWKYLKMKTTKVKVTGAKDDRQAVDRPKTHMDRLEKEIH